MSPAGGGIKGVEKERGYHAKKTKAGDANNCAMNKHSRFAVCLQKKVCGIYPEDCGVFDTVGGGHVGCTILTRVSWFLLIS
ncbi:MAG: hypothetical protein CV082_01940 [Candidatus Brocadia sp. BL1]|nr:MAG: hypothetical protein CV082_01940 [Candidatus Brocadia sp. BL1]